MGPKKFFYGAVCALAAVAVPLLAWAHEVYVLSSSSIARDVAMPPFNMLEVAAQNLHAVIFWGLIGVLAISFVFLISTLNFLQSRLAPDLG